MTQARTSCAMTYSIQVYNNVTSEWDTLDSNYNFYRSDTSNSLTYNVAPADYMLYHPEIIYEIKVTWTSTYSERTDDATVVENFKIWF